MKKILIALSTLFLASLSFAEIIQCRVVDVRDGDSFVCIIKKQQFNIKLHQIDAPELNQPYGLEAKQNLSKEILGKNISFYPAEEQDSFILAIVILEADNNQPNLDLLNTINYKILNQGNAWHIPDEFIYWGISIYHMAENQAKNAKRGLWADPNPIPPWIWRKMSIQKSKRDADRILQEYRHQNP